MELKKKMAGAIPGKKQLLWQDQYKVKLIWQGQYQE